MVVSSGQIVYDGDHTRTAVSSITCRPMPGDASAGYLSAPGRMGPHLAAARVETSEPDGEHEHGKPIVFEFDISVPEPRQGLCFSFQVVNGDSLPVCHFWLLSSDNAFGSTVGMTACGARCRGRACTWERII